MFSIYGEVLLAEVVEDQVARRHKGFALVRFARASEADAAIVGHNGAEFHGRKLLVRKDSHFVPSPAIGKSYCFVACCLVSHL
jgi:RNA recognition motif-containing protein